MIRVLLLLCLTCTGSHNAIAAEKDEAERNAAVLEVLDDFIAAFSARDPQAHTATYHFPHYRLARGAMSLWETRDVAIEDHVRLFKTLPDTGWHRSEWVHRRIVTSSPNKVHVDTQFKRLRKDGSEIGRYHSLYILIKKDGRWGIKMRSSFL